MAHIFYAISISSITNLEIMASENEDEQQAPHIFENAC